MSVTTSDVQTRLYKPTPRVRVFIEDMGQALCYATHCEGTSDDLCGHRRQAAEFVYATIDHFITEFERAGNYDAAETLRGSM